MFNKLKSMAIFAEVAHLGSFRAAAKSQGLSPSVISQQVSRLEDNLGETLLNRSTRNLALTSVGEKFLVHCDEMLKAANQGMASVMQNANQGSLRMTLPGVLAVTRFGEVIESYRQQNPLINLSMVFDDEHIDIVEAGIDVALRIGWLEDSSLKARRIMHIPRVIVSSPEYLDKIGSINQPKDLEKCCWIGRANPAIRPYLHSQEGKVHTIPKRSSFIQVNNAEAIRALVLSKNGIGLFPELLVEQDIADGKLVRLLTDWRVESPNLYAVWSAQRATGQLIKNFVDFVMLELSNNDSTRITKQ